MFMIGWYQPIWEAPPDRPMPTYPLSEFDPTTGRLPASTPGAAIGNAFLGAVCSGLNGLETLSQFRQSVGLPSYPTNVPGLSEALGFWCRDPATPVPSLPSIPTPPVWDYGGYSSGSYAGVLLVGQNPRDYSQRLPFDGQWDCSQNVGLPITGVRYLNLGGGTSGYVVRCRRGDGTEHEVAVSAGNTFTEPERLILQSIQISNCNPGLPPPILPPTIQYPPPTTAEPPPVPQFPINISLPQLPGFPDLIIPVVYVPITPTLQLSPTIEFRPTINLPGLPAIAPNIEIGLGGLTIGGNGGARTTNELTTITNNGGNTVCPDPCEPIDYDRIREISFEELDSKFPPGRPNIELSVESDEADSNVISLPPFSIYVTLAIVLPGRNTRSQSGGGASPDIYYNGWYSFGTTTSAGERVPFNYNLASFPVPDGATKFSYCIVNGGTAKVIVTYKEVV